MDYITTVAKSDIDPRIGDVLGCGYDITQGYARSSDIKKRVLNLSVIADGELVKRDTNMVIGRHEHISGTDVNAYQYKLSQKVTASAKASVLGKGSFSSEVRTSFGMERTETNQYMFCTRRENSHKIAYVIDKLELSDNIGKYLSAEFKNDVEKMNPTALIVKYGTHVMLGGILGARLDYHLSTKNIGSESVNRLEVYASVKASAAFKGIGGGGGVSAETVLNTEKSFDTSSTKTTTIAFGGKPEFASRVDDPASYQKWLDSIDGNEVWVDYYPNSLFLLSEFVPPAHKAVVQGAIDAHLNRAALNPTAVLKNGVLKLPTRRIQSTATNIGKGDSEIFSRDNSNTEWELQTDLSLFNYDVVAGEYKTLIANFIYTVREIEGDWTVLQMKHEEHFNISDIGVIDLVKVSNLQRGNISGHNHNFNNVPQNNSSFFSKLEVKIDGHGDDNNHLALMVTFAIPDVEVDKKLTEETP